MMKVGIAVYLQSNDTWHWALVATDQADWHTQPLQVMQIINTFGPWSHLFKFVVLHQSGTFRGIIHLFEMDGATALEFSEFARQIEPLNLNGWVFPGSGPDGWTCASWVLKVLQHFHGQQWDPPSQFELTYHRILAFAEIIKRQFTSPIVFPIMVYT